MKKVFGASLIALGLLSVTNPVFYATSKAGSDLQLENIDAQSSSIGEWWDRKDYDCKEVTCDCTLYTYRSTVSKYVGNGNGSVAHSWSCPGCGDCGWLTN